MSITNKIWRVLNPDKSGDLLSRLAQSRSMTKDEMLQSFVDFDVEGNFHDPFLFEDMRKAVDRINQAIKANEKIIIFGDYDVDGISGTAVLVKALQKLGANVSYRIPHRVNDGYGLNIRFIDEFIELKLGLLITVDCGISCAQEVKKASDNGISVIITDHHTIPEQKPEAALAIIHPLREDCSYPFKGLTGAAVSYKLAQALLLENLEREQALEMIDDLSDLSSLGTVADCGHLIGENRAIVSKGLRKLQNSKWNGIKALLEISGLTSENINASSIGFKIAPRINAAGRIDNPLFALQMLLIEDDEAKVSALAQKLEQINQKRQKMLEVALQKALSNDSHTVERVIIDSNPDWHVGILGLIAGRLAGDTGKPAIMMQDMGDRLVGSARSNESFNVVEALTAHSELLDHFGGHHQAAGFDLKKENLEKFVKSMRAYAAENLKNTDLKPTLNLDCLLSGEEINWENWELLEKMAPFGYGNEEPVFIMENVRPQELSIVGKTKEHLSMKFVFNNQEVRSIAFKMGEFAEFVRQKDTIDLACKIQKNVWRDKASLQMQIIDIR